ncbi:MAG: hypothetical protein WA793_10695 [Sphingorhabdus sp.]|uniref:hypothetical protein n=1 Tax=Sphingorhabdus sp. TaxID=1902408 RepID=UPI003CA4CD4D
MAVNIFEELVKTYLQAQGYFVMENVSFGLDSKIKIDPKYNTDPSDIDIVAIKPRSPKEPVLVVSCKGSTKPFDVGEAANQIMTDGSLWGRDAWRHFRELAVDEWATALIHRVRHLAGTTNIQHMTAVVSYHGNEIAWRENETFKRRMGGNSLKLLSLSQIVNGLKDSNALPHKSSQATQLIEMFKSA